MEKNGRTAIEMNCREFMNGVEPKGTFARKLMDCERHNFYQHVRKDEGPRFNLFAVLPGDLEEQRGDGRLGMNGLRAETSYMLMEIFFTGEDICRQN